LGHYIRFQSNMNILLLKQQFHSNIRPVPHQSFQNIFHKYFSAGVGNCFGSGGHSVEVEVGGGPHLLKWLHSLVNFAFQKRYKLYHKNQ
jgi:hypothetical protein